MSLSRIRFALVIPLLFTFAIIVADGQEAVCQEIVAGALTRLSERCADLARNSVCYGHAQVDASFAGGAAASAFAAPGARAPLAQLKSLRTSRLDVESGHWGLAVLHLQANLPQSRPGSGVILLLAGDAKLEHDVDVAQIDEIREPLSTAALEPTGRFAQAAAIAEELGQLQKGEIALVDARTSDGAWLRLVKDGAVSWVERDHLAPLQGMASLPVIDVADSFAMRAFTLSSWNDKGDCDAAEPLLAIQTPDTLGVNLTINGVDIHVQSLVSFQQVHRNALSMTVHRGAATTAFGNRVLAGSTVLGILADIGNGKTIVLDWSGALPSSDAELARGHRLQEALQALAGPNGWGEQGGKLALGDVIHVVVRGDSLFSLARRYDVRVADIIGANSHRSPLRLYVGDELLIPNPGSGFGGFGPAEQVGAAEQNEDAEPIADRPETAGTDCSGLRLTSPIGSASGAISAYYWDGIPGVGGYQVKVYDHGTGSLLGSFHTSAGQTSVSFSAGQLGVGGAMQWEVIALAEGAPICSTGKSAPLPHR